MAIPATPTSFAVQTGNQQNLVSWAISAGATSYIVQRSLDNVTFTTLATVSGSPLATSYVDSAVVLGTQYWYQLAAANTSGTSPYTQSQSAIPTLSGEMSLAQLRLAAQQRSDLVNSGFVSNPEWNTFINQSMLELYDLLITTYEDYYLAPPVQFTTNGSAYQFPVPDGVTQFYNPNNNTLFTPAPLYKLLGVDLSLQNATNAYVTIQKFNWIDRNAFVFPNTASAIYGVFNTRYRLMGNIIEFIPTPSGAQNIRLWYIPRLPQLLQDTDTTTVGISGWTQYIIIRAAMYALSKEESDISALQQELLYLKERIETTASNRDAGMPDTVSNMRAKNGYWGDGHGGFSGGWGGPF